LVKSGSEGQIGILADGCRGWYLKQTLDPDNEVICDRLRQKQAFGKKN